MDKNKQNVVIKEVEDKEEKNTRKIYGIMYAIEEELKKFIH